MIWRAYASRPSFITEPVCEQFRALCRNGRCRTPRVGIDTDRRLGALRPAGAGAISAACTNRSRVDGVGDDAGTSGSTLEEWQRWSMYCTSITGSSGSSWATSPWTGASRRRSAVLSSPGPARWNRAGHQTLVRGVHRGTRDIIRDAKWSQPVGFQAPGGVAL
jgi:hypothetical protein